MPYLGRGPGFGIRQKYFYTATAGQTSISGSDNNGISLTFTDSLFVDVYLNGVLLDPNSDYNTTTANTIAGLSALSLNDFVEIVAYDSFSIGDVVPASSGGTFSGAVTVQGDLSVSGTLNVTGDSSSGDDAAIGNTAAEGLILTGQGSSNDITVKNDADTTVLTVATGTTNVDIVGDVTASTLNADGDTSAGDNAAIGYTAAEGLILTGQGSTSDITVKNDADTEVFSIATGGTVVDFASTPTVDGSAIAVGKQTMWIPAGAMYPSSTNPCAALTQVETTALRPDLKVLDFDASSDEFAQFSVAFPKSWNEGTVTFQPFWTVTGTNTGTVAWQLGGIAVSSDDSINTAFGTLVATTALAHSGTSNDLMVSVESGNVTIAGTPAAGDCCFFQINRDVSADNQSGDARLIGIKLFFTTDASNDS